MFAPHSKARVFHNVQTGMQVQGLLWFVEGAWAVRSEGELSESRLCDLLGVILIGLLHRSASASSEWWSESNELPYTYSVLVLSRACCIISAHNYQFSSFSIKYSPNLCFQAHLLRSGHKEHLAFLLPWQIFAFPCCCSCANLEWLLSSLSAGWNPTQISKLKSKTTAFMKPFQYLLSIVCTSLGGSSYSLIYSFSSALSVHLSLNSLSLWTTS